MAFSMSDASAQTCAKQLGALATIINRVAAHCVANKIEEAALLSDLLYSDMFRFARHICQTESFGHDTPGRLAGVASPEFVAAEDKDVV